MKNKTARLTQGNFENEKYYSESPIEVAKHFEDAGVKRIHLVDLDGAKKGASVNFHALEMIANFTDLKINFSGGVHNDGDVSAALEAGAESITAATIAVYDRELFSSWLMSFGREKIALGADILNDHLRVGGWQKDAKISLSEHVSFYYDRGLKYLKTTDIAKDGLLEGPSFDLYAQLLKEFPNIKLFASGGVRNMDDIKKLADLGVYGVIFGKAFYENKITLKDIETFVLAQ